MQIDVIVLLRKTTQAIAAWQYAADARGQLFTLHKHGARFLSEIAWKQLAVKINRLACNSRTPVDVFLLLRNHLVENFCDLGRMEEIVNLARDHAWGGNIYIVWDQEPDTEFHSIYKGNETVLEEWFSMLIQLGVTDLIAIPKRVRSKEQDEYNILRVCALEADNRRRRLRKFVVNNGWKGVLPGEAHFLEEFIGRLIRTGLLPPNSRNQAVFYHRKPRRGLTHLLEKSRHLYRGGKRFVAAVPGIIALDLEELWKQEPGFYNNVFEYNTVFEWLYALIRLNQASRSSAESAATDSYQDYISSVEPGEGMRFQSKPNDTELRLLVTSAFHPSQDTYHCVEAAKEVGAVLRGLPFHIDVVTHPCIVCERLPDLLDAGPFTAWLHIGHGKQALGFYEAQSNEYAEPERWVTCFNKYRGSLQLVVLSACESANVAELFAASGVRVAIGFEKEVTPIAARTLSEKVIPAALQPGDRQAAILNAFREACVELSGRTDAYSSYIDALPRAFFSANLKPS